MEQFIRHQPGPPQETVTDLDSTDDEVHGHQQLRLFQAYYDAYCCLPLIVTAIVRRVLIRCPKAYPWPKLWFQILEPRA